MDFLGINTIYVLDDPGSEMIRLIDGIKLNRFFQRSEFVKLYERFVQNKVTLTHKERIKLIDRIYLDISTWIYKNYDTSVDMNDKIGSMLVSLILKSIIDISEKQSNTSVSMSMFENIMLYDYSNRKSQITGNDGLDIVDRLWIHTEGQSYDNWMQLLSPDDANKVITAGSDGDSVAGPYITNVIEDHNSTDIVTENSVTEYVEKMAITEDDIATSKTMAKTLEEASDEKVISEKALYDTLQLNVLKDQ